MSDLEGEDEFQDAQEYIPLPSMDFDTAILQAQQAVHYFLNNDFEKAKQILEPWSDNSMYHSLGNSLFAFLEATLTFEQKDVTKASKALKQCISVCSKHRKQTSTIQNIGKMVKKTNYDSYTNEEVHAELCYAESLLLKSMLMFLEDETLVNFVKAAMKIRTCYLSYKECSQILNTRKWENETSKMHFESGVRMGIGTFNLLISLLPERVIKLLEFIGFSGDKNYGLKQLQAGYDERKGLRQVLCAMTLLSYNLIIITVLCNKEGDLDWCEKVLNEQLTLYPDGIWFLMLKARLELTRGNIEKSIDWYTKSWKSQSIWPHFHHICFWELMWAHCIQKDWNKALKYAEKLSKYSKWSRTIYLYQQAVIMMMMKPLRNSKEQMDIDELMMQAPTYKQRIAGKSLPMEKFLIKKTERYFSQKKNLILPIFELMYIYNLFTIIGKRRDKLMSIFKTIEDEEVVFIKKSKDEFYADNKALILLLKGACLRQMKLYRQAEEYLVQVLEIDKEIKEDTYLVPFAFVELAMLALEQGKNKTAMCFLENLKKNYTAYSLESKLHFRIHSIIMEISNKKSKEIVESRLQLRTLSDSALTNTVNETGSTSISSSAYKLSNNINTYVKT